MIRKILIYSGIGLLLISLQGLLGPWLTIQKIRPDFLLIFVMYVGQKEGKIFGQLTGFSTGLLLDFLGMGTFLGLSVFTKTLSGFLAGYLKNQKNKINIFSYYVIILLIFFVHFYLFYSLYYHSMELSLQYRLARYILPSLIYTGVFYFLVEFIFSRQE
jgi:rod shape-determining protein MreD